jgi:hypothetical protein
MLEDETDRFTEQDGKPRGRATEQDEGGVEPESRRPTAQPGSSQAHAPPPVASQPQAAAAGTITATRAQTGRQELPGGETSSGYVGGW